MQTSNPSNLGMFNKKFLGSNLALAIGVLTALGGLANASSGLFAGVYVVLGALAYKSLKKRKLRLVRDSKLRPMLELGAIVVMLLLIFMQNNLATNLVEDPVPNIIIPAWVIIAYLVMYFRSSNSGVESSSS